MKKPIWWLILVVVLGGAVVLYYRLNSEKSEPQVLHPPPAPSAEPVIRHPIEAVPPPDESTGEPTAEPAEPLPALADSDGAMREALTGLFGRRLEKFFNLHGIIHRIVATVDNLPRDNLSAQLMPVKPVEGWLVTEGEGESLRVSPKNAARYAPYVRLAEAVPTRALVAVYVRFYPLFQQQYEELGYPGKYFNDRLVQVIDHLLAAPEVQGPVRLTQPKVLYQFADPELARLSDGQKILVRMGSENAAKVKAKLREIRSVLVAKPPQSKNEPVSGTTSDNPS
jgi:hypothetical protein